MPACFEGIEGEALIFMLSSQGSMATPFGLRLSGPQDLAGFGRYRPSSESGPGPLYFFTLNRTNREEEVHHVLEHLLRSVENTPVISSGLAEEIGRRSRSLK
jgi:hypothetical protein